MANKPKHPRPSKRKPQVPLAQFVEHAQQSQDYARTSDMLSPAGRRVMLVMSNRSLCKVIRRGADKDSIAECRRSLDVNLAHQRKLVAKLPRNEWRHYLKSLMAQSGGNI